MPSITGTPVDPEGMGGGAGATITFGNSISGSTNNVRQLFLDLLSTTMPVYGIAFGGVTDTSAAFNQYLYNSSPFGNCGQLNALGGAYLSATFGYEYKLLYSDFGHVICEVHFPDGWRIVETFGAIGDNHFIDPAAPDSDPFYTLEELQAALDNDPTGIWDGVNQNVRNYYGDSGATITDSGKVYTNVQFKASSLTLAANETVEFEIAPYNQNMLYGMGQASALASQSYTSNQSPVADQVTVVRTENAGSPAIEHIENGKPITGVGLRPQPGFTLPPTIYQIQSWYAAPVYAVAPTGTIALPEFTRDVAQPWIGNWTVPANTTLDTGAGVIISGDGAAVHLEWNGDYQNTTGSAQTIWVPIVFRTDTPTPKAGGAAVAVLTINGQTFAIAPTDGDLHYREFLVTLAPGQSLSMALDVTAGRNIDILALGTETNISDIISPDDPVMAIDVDLSQISYRSNLDLDYSVQVGPGETPSLATNEVINNKITPLVLRDPLTLNEAVVTRTESVNSPAIEHIANAFYVTDVSFSAKAGLSVSASYLAAIADATKIWATAPDADIALPTFQSHVQQNDWLNAWKPFVSTTTTTIHNAGDGIVHVENPNDGTTRTYLSWNGGSGSSGSPGLPKDLYLNSSTSTQTLWIPLAYRTDTPSPVGFVGTPVATLWVGNNAYNIYPQDRDLHYKDIVVQVDPGETVRIYLQIEPGSKIDIYALGSGIDLSGFLGPVNPAQAVDVDFSGLAAAGLSDYQSKIDLNYALMVSPYLDDPTITADADGADLFSPRTGGITMVGGPGFDSFHIHNADDVIIKTKGTGAVYLEQGDYSGFGGTYVAPARITDLVMHTSDVIGHGNGLNNNFHVNDPNQVIVEDANAGTDTVFAAYNYTLLQNFENLTLTGVATIGVGNDATNNLTGNALDNVMNGGIGNDRLYGGDGNDVLEGGPGKDLLVGGKGNDSYLIDSTTDVVKENPGEGIDGLYAGFSYALPENVENLLLTGSAAKGVGNADTNIIAGNGIANTLLGMGGNDYLYGYAGNDMLDGGAGVDAMIGGDGNDSYYVDDTFDVISELSNGGMDGVYATATYFLSANIENMRLMGSAIGGTGNALDNTISGNTMDNNLAGGEGRDHLFGYEGNDVLDGGTGADWLYGGIGNDSYLVDNALDIITENSGEGISDAVYASINFRLPGNVENLLLQSNAAIGAGNELANIVAGNASNNILYGMGGSDYLYGHDGSDTIDGGAGIDTMTGGKGNDVYYLDNSSEVIVEVANDGTDSVLAGADYILPANVENMQLTGAAHSGTGNELNNTLVGGTGSDTLNGMGGNDYLVGSAGNDVLMGGTGSDQFKFAAGFGNDTIADFTFGQDRIVIDHTLFADFAAVQDHMSQVGDATVITYSAADTITVNHDTAVSLTASDFLFV